MSRYKLYEILKEQIARESKSKEKYEKRIKTLAKKLRI